MNTILTTLVTYLVIDAVASLVVFFAFKYSKTLRSRLYYVVRNFFGISRMEDTMYVQNTNTNSRIDREIFNRQVLKTRVNRMNRGPKSVTYEDLTN